MGREMEGFSVAGEWQKFLSAFSNFFASVDWTEPWLVALGVFHSIWLILAITTKKYVNVQMLIGISLVFLVFAASSLNQLAIENWQLFASRNYFDEEGFFISAVYSLPLALIMLFL